MPQSGFVKRHYLRLSLSLAIVLLSLLNALGFLNFSYVQRLENYTYDLRLQWMMPNTQHKRVVIVDIDEKSLQQMGHWPWSRNKLATLVDQLFDHYQIDVLGFDMVFAESDQSSGIAKLEELAHTELRGDAGFQTALSRIKPSLDYDQIFANSLKNRRVALGYYFRHQRDPDVGKGSLPPPSIAAGGFDSNGLAAKMASGFTANLPELQKNAAAAGFFDVDTVTDSDGVLRRIPLLQQYRGALYEALPLAVARLALREPLFRVLYAGAQQGALADTIKLGARRIPIDIDVAALIPYRGMQGSFHYVSAVDVFQRAAPTEILKGAIVLVGATAPGLMDLRSTPMQEVYPGVEASANLVAGILDGSIKERVSDSVDPTVELAPLLAIGLLLTFTWPALNQLWATALSLGTVLALSAFNLFMWKTENLVLPIASILWMMALLYVFNIAYGFFIESRGKRLLAGRFGQYVPPELVEEMARDPESFSLEGESRELTVLFSDVRGFTTISEGLDPRQLTQLMNEFLSPMTHVIQRHRGTIDKYMGDAIMAFWGAPLADPLHARHALLAGMEMIAQLESLQDHFKTKGWPPIRIGVGLNTGEMTVGNMGSEFRMAYTVMGDAVNLGSRLEGLTKEYGVQIMVSEFTKAAVPDFIYRQLDCVRVKGKEQPVFIYEPICSAGEEDAELKQELALHAEALSSYRSQDWGAALVKFAELRELCPGRYLYELYEKRIAYLSAHPPGPEWDGAFTFTTK